MKNITKILLILPDDPQQVQLEQALYKAAPKDAHVIKISAVTAGMEPPISFGILHRQGEIALQNSGLHYTILRSTMFFQTLERFSSPILKAKTLLMPCQNGRVCMVDIHDVAECAWRLLKEENNDHHGKIYAISGAEAFTMTQVAELLSQRLGYTITHRSPPGWVAYWVYRVLAGLDGWLAKNVTDLFVSIAQGAELEPSNNAIVDLLERPPQTLSEYLGSSLVFAPSGAKKL